QVALAAPGAHDSGDDETASQTDAERFADQMADVGDAAAPCRERAKEVHGHVERDEDPRGDAQGVAGEPHPPQVPDGHFVERVENQEDAGDTGNRPGSAHERPVTTEREPTQPREYTACQVEAENRQMAE